MTVVTDGPFKGLKKPRRIATEKEAQFARLIVAGKTQQDAYIEAYQPKTENISSLNHLAHRVMNREHVRRMVDKLRSRSEVRTILSLNDRLEILARDAQLPGKTAAMAQARARSIKVYSDISGDRAPEKRELTGKDGQPIAVSLGVLVRQMSARDRLAEMKAARLVRDRPVELAAPTEVAQIEPPYVPPAPEPEKPA
jgi:hypothetical protein